MKYSCILRVCSRISMNLFCILFLQNDSQCIIFQLLVLDKKKENDLMKGILYFYSCEDE